MPEITIQDRYADLIPRFTLPPELTNKPAEAPKETPKEPEKPVAEVKPEVKAEAVEATVETEAPERAEETTEKDPEKATTRRFERRIDRAHKRAAEAQARAELLAQELAEIKAKSQPPQVSPNAPRMEDFTDVQEYAKAYAAHEKTQAIKEYEAKQRQEATQAQSRKMAQEWESKVSKAQAKYDDWDEVVGDIKPTTPWAYAMMEADNGHDIAHYLGTHSAEVKRISALSPSSQFREIGKLELKLQTPAEPPKKPSKAPAPIEPVKGDAKSSGDDIEPQMDFEKYKKIGDKMFRRRT